MQKYYLTPESEEKFKRFMKLYPLYCSQNPRTSMQYWKTEEFPKKLKKLLESAPDFRQLCKSDDLTRLVECPQSKHPYSQIETIYIEEISIMREVFGHNLSSNLEFYSRGVLQITVDRVNSRNGETFTKNFTTTYYLQRHPTVRFMHIQTILKKLGM